MTLFIFLFVVFSVVWKNIHIHYLDLLNFVYIVVFNVETVPKSAKLAILG